MKIIGLITEYNPLHNGHLYHIRRAKELTGADALVAVMSGNFVQRGGPAILPKHLRAKAALEAGLSAVFELPAWCACGSAEFFASGAVSILDRLGCIDGFCFGSECGEISLLKKAAGVLAQEPPAYKTLLKDGLKRGLSFPKARQHALTAYTKDPRMEELLSSPNNILGIEYIKAALRRNSRMKAYTIQRKGAAYHEDTLTDGFSSASAIRKRLKDSESRDLLSDLRSHLPPSSFRLLQSSYRKYCPIYADDFSLLIRYRLLTESPDSLARYADLSPALANRIFHCLNQYTTFDQFCGLLKTKEITHTRISRALFHILLQITKEDLQQLQADGGCGYARMLGFRKQDASLLKLLKQHSRIPVITSPARPAVLTSSAQKMLKSDIFVSNLYESVVSEKYGTPYVHECRKQVVIL